MSDIDRALVDARRGLDSHEQWLAYFEKCPHGVEGCEQCRGEAAVAGGIFEQRTWITAYENIIACLSEAAALRAELEAEKHERDRYRGWYQDMASARNREAERADVAEGRAEELERENARLLRTVQLAATEADVPKWLRARAQADCAALPKPQSADDSGALAVPRGDGQ